MERSWQLQHAKNRFSEVVDKALTEGPQTISRRGKDTVVVISLEEFRKTRAPQGSLVDFLRSLSLAKAQLNLARQRDTDRSASL